MGFTTSIFSFVFMPFSIICYFLTDFLTRNVPVLKRLRFNDITLVVLSIIFYGWACADYVVWLPLYIILVYFFGVLISKTQNLYVKLPIYYKENNIFFQTAMLRIGTGVFAFTIIVLVSILIRYKYADFLNDIFASYGINIHRGFLSMAPLGISFIVFSSISYLTDIKTRKARQGTFLDCALYITFFPKIVSGPITLWRDFSLQTGKQQMNLKNATDGINRICIGFAKKVLLADAFGYAIVQIENKGYYGIDTPTVWIAVLLYMLQIYYDFSGYSDIAIGLSRVIGFDYKENFNFPYRSLSITEFWRRWHISLGTWFREYVYIPLGGNRKGQRRTLANLGVVFILTGIWHGAGWNYILWGALNGLIVIWERITMNKPFYRKVPSIVKWIGTMFIVMLLWQFFRYPSLSEFCRNLTAMFTNCTQQVTFTWKFFLDRKLITLVIIGLMGTTVMGIPRLKMAWEKISWHPVAYVIQEVCMLLLLLLSIIVAVNATYSPFIYFQY